MYNIDSAVHSVKQLSVNVLGCLIGWIQVLSQGLSDLMKFCFIYCILLFNLLLFYFIIYYSIFFFNEIDVHNFVHNV